jgi:CRISPR-associated protein Csd2
MNDSIHTDVNRRHDFVLLFDVTDGNPNGDPDAGNLPRVDPETMQGLVTDVSLKRRVRNWVDASQAGQRGFRIYIQNKGIALNTLHQEAYDAVGLKSTGSKQKRADIDKARGWMCEHFFDIRTFGAVMTTGVNCGQVRGPVQMTFARSIDPLIPLEVAITRVAITDPKKADVVVQESGETTGGSVTEMGRKSLVPYGLYRAYGFVTPSFAQQTSFSSQDLAIFWDALVNMWDLDRSSSRGLTACRCLYVFTHDGPLGNAPASRLFDRVSVQRRDGSDVPRSFGDYELTMEDSSLPAGVTMASLAD